MFSMMDTFIIGIDCATEPQKRGVSVARIESGRCQVSHTETGLTDSEITELIIQCKDLNARVLLALDAPLGWPNDLGKSLVSHQAGCCLALSSNVLFRRETDRFIKRTFNKQPLDVGADRIARTAHSALSLLDEIANKLETNIPLAWDENFAGIAAIEVYPAATLLAYGLPASGYKKPADKSVRQQIINGLGQYLFLQDTKPLLLNADALDAALCVLAATDFIDGAAYPPITIELARKEGWIWVTSRMVNGID